MKSETETIFAWVLGREQELETGRTCDTLLDGVRRSPDAVRPEKKSVEKRMPTRREFAGGLRHPDTGKTTVLWSVGLATSSSTTELNSAARTPKHQPVGTKIKAGNSSSAGRRENLTEEQQSASNRTKNQAWKQWQIDLEQNKQHKTRSKRNNFFIAIRTRLQPIHGGHRSPSLIWLKTKNSLWLTSTLRTKK
jgi:hypothetical protein